MRNLLEHPICDEEVEEVTRTLIKQLNDEQLIGDIRPIALAMLLDSWIEQKIGEL